LPPAVFRSRVDKIIVRQPKNFQQDQLAFLPIIDVTSNHCRSYSGWSKQERNIDRNKIHSSGST
jgi:hypothetical protein